MQRILRSVLAMFVLLALAVGAAACGGDEATESSSVDDLLTKTFNNDEAIKSGKLDVEIKASATGPSAGDFSVKLAGPFQSTGKGELPKFDLDLIANIGQEIRAGLESTGEKGFVNVQGTEYAVDPALYTQLKTSYKRLSEQAKKDNKQKDVSLKTLGMDPRKWLSNARNAGEAKVGDTDTIRITGDVDVAKLLDDVNQGLAKASSLGLQGASKVPSKLTDKQQEEVRKALKDLKVEIYTGKDDAILRRIAVAFTIKDPNGSSGSATVAFDLKLLDVNEDQEFVTPQGARPFSELGEKLQGLGLGGLGSLGAGGGSSGSGSSGSSSGSGSGSASGSGNSEQLKKLTDCLEKAGQDQAEQRKCAALLNG